jgi:MFS family permease
VVRVSRTPSRNDSLWRHRDFRLLVGAQSVTQLGADIGAVVFPLVALLLLDASPLEMGIVVAIQNGASLILGLPAGAWIDRMSRRPVMIASDIVRALALATVPLAAALNQLTMIQIYVVAAVTSVGKIFFDVAYLSYLPSLVSREHLVEGNSKLESIRAVAQTGGPSLGGWLIQLVGASPAVLADAISFVGSAIFLASIRSKEPKRERRRRAPSWTEVTDGLRFVIHHSVLRMITLSSAVWNFFLHGAIALTMIFLSQTLALTPATIGLLFVAAPLASILGAAATAPLARALGSARLIWLSATVTAPFALLVPMTTPGAGLALFLLSNAVCSFGQLVFNVSQTSFRQAICPDRLQGRTNAASYVLGMGAAPLGALLGGALGSAVGVRGAMWIVSAGLASSCIPLLLSPLIRMRDSLEPVAVTKEQS